MLFLSYLLKNNMDRVSAICKLTMKLYVIHMCANGLCPFKVLQTRIHCCGHIVADTNVSPFTRARNICCGHKFCVRDTKNVSDFVQKYLVSATNVSQFPQPKKHNEKQCVRNNVSLFASTFKLLRYTSSYSLSKPTNRVFLVVRSLLFD